MILFKILQMFLLPSVFVPSLILVGVIFISKSKKQKIGKILIITSLVLYYIFSITPVADLILLPLEKQYNQIEKEKLEAADKIVLLLGGKESDVLRASEILKIVNRKPQIAKIIISGTDPLKGESKEAEGVKDFLIERGVAKEKIILETKSRNTFESAKNIKELIGSEPFFLVTSAYHMPRAIESFRKMGMNPVAAPTDFKIEKSYDILDFFPDAQNLRNLDLAFHEYFGIIFYRLKY